MPNETKQEGEGPYAFINVHYPGDTNNPEEYDLNVEGPCLDEICGVLSDLPTDGELKVLNIAFNAGRSTLLPLVRELLKVAETLGPKCDVCRKLTPCYIEDNGIYCSLNCWEEANGGNGEGYELQTFEPSKKLIDLLAKAKKEAGIE